MSNDLKELKALTVTIIFKAQSLNYGEGIANISELKKLTRADGNLYTFASRQCLRYDIVRIANELYDWNLQVVDSSKGTIQFKNNINIDKSEEMDLFGYMKTSKKDAESKGGSLVRPAVVRLSNAISLEPFRSDMDFLNNKGFADRIGEHPNLANIEQHLSLYTYTITIDLSKVGVDGQTVLDKSIRYKRVKELLEIIKILNRKIRGRHENLAPLFIIGGIYPIANPFFLGRINIAANSTGYSIDSKILSETLKTKFLEQKVMDFTSIGIVDGVFNNKNDLEDILPKKVISVEKFFDELEQNVKKYYEV